MTAEEMQRRAMDGFLLGVMARPGVDRAKAANAARTLAEVFTDDGVVWRVRVVVESSAKIAPGKDAPR